MASRRDDSDPLPFVQVDRSVDPKALALSQLTGVPFAHALGALVQWWRRCSDPRELEQVIEDSPAGAEPVLAYSLEAVERRWFLATGLKVAPPDLAEIGILEARTDDYRVRGMSRYFRPLLNRRRLAEAGRKGRAAQLEAGQGAEQGPGPGPGVARGWPENDPSKTGVARARPGGGPGVARAPSGQEIKDQRSEEEDLFGKVLKGKATRSLSPAEELFAKMQRERNRYLEALGESATPEPISPAFVNTAIPRICKDLGFSEPADLLNVWYRYLEAEWAAGKSPPWAFKVFASPKVYRVCAEQADRELEGRTRG